MTRTCHGEPTSRQKLVAVVAVNAVNYASALIVGLYFFVVFPPENAAEPGGFDLLTWVVLATAYCLASGISASRRGLRYAGDAWAWFGAGGGEPPSPEVRDRAIALPAFFTWMTVRRWSLAAVLFTPLAALESAQFAMEVFVTLMLSALTVSAAVYLVAERVMRPLVARVLEHGVAPGRSLGVGPRLLLAWALCSALPLIMLALIPVGREVADPSDLVPPTMFVAAAALVAGLLATKLTTQRVAEPLTQLREAAEAVADGDLDVRVDVDDASEVGLLQAGFNEMVAGLRERERLRDLVDHTVGRDVAVEALERGATLGGQVRTCSALFVDVVGSTGFASRERPEAVVEQLNRFFATVVEVVERHGGFVNKFEGDGALCLFGAPAAQPRHATCALGAARDLHDALLAAGALPAAIGVSCGPVVAGWVGAESRFEYTVVGDAVNEAARLTELAKEHHGRVLAAAPIVEAADEEEAGRWELGDEVVLRGRDRPTRLAHPRRSALGAAAAEARPASGVR